jgi:hypothetical protein
MIAAKVHRLMAAQDARSDQRSHVRREEVLSTGPLFIPLCDGLVQLQRGLAPFSCAVVLGLGRRGAEVARVECWTWRRGMTSASLRMPPRGRPRAPFAMDGGFGSRPSLSWPKSFGLCVLRDCIRAERTNYPLSPRLQLSRLDARVRVLFERALFEELRARKVEHVVDQLEQVFSGVERCAARPAATCLRSRVWRWARRADGVVELSKGGAGDRGALRVVC